jgi:hypothetical protein
MSLYTELNNIKISNESFQKCNSSEDGKKHKQIETEFKKNYQHTDIRECLLPFSPASFDFQFAVQKYTYVVCLKSSVNGTRKQTN